VHLSRVCGKPRRIAEPTAGRPAGQRARAGIGSEAASATSRRCRMIPRPGRATAAGPGQALRPRAAPGGDRLPPHGYTLAQLAEHHGCHYSTVSKRLRRDEGGAGEMQDLTPFLARPSASACAGMRGAGEMQDLTPVPSPLSGRRPRTLRRRLGVIGRSTSGSRAVRGRHDSARQARVGLATRVSEIH
jgi:hypothetical protein